MKIYLYSSLLFTSTNMKLCLSLLLIFSYTFYGNLYAQKIDSLNQSNRYVKKWIGINLTTEYSLGITAEQQVTKRHGIESGLYFSPIAREYAITITTGSNSQSYPFSITSYYLNIPVLYKFHTRYLNIAAGVTFNYFVGWRQSNGEVQVSSFSPSNKFSVNVLAKISSPIKLSPRTMLEPEIRVNPFFELETPIFLGIPFKYQF